MPRPIQDHALIGDLHSAALVASDGSIDWLCLPRFDAQACFAAILGNDRHGHWRIGPLAAGARVERRYVPGTLVLETEFSTGSGTVRLTDCMPPRRGAPVVARMVEGISGEVGVRMTLAASFEYGSARPRIRGHEGALAIAAGSQALWLFSPAHTEVRQGVASAEFTLSAGDRVPFALVWRPAPADPPSAPSVPALIEQTTGWWADWVARLNYDGQWRDPVIRSLITLKALTYEPTGGLIAAPTTSLPQQASGDRNWDYRYCWLRDAAAALRVLLSVGATDDAAAVLGWINLATAGRPAEVQAAYGVAGERRLPEIVLDWLPGHDGARPVRIGNAVAAQPRIAALGEVLTACLAARMAGLPGSYELFPPEELLECLRAGWHKPDHGVWELRGPARQFVYSKVMAWAAADAAVKMIERFGDPGPARELRRLRRQIRTEVLSHGYDAGRRAFVLHYDGTALDASLLRLPQLGLLPASNERVTGTIAAVLDELDRGGVLLRFQPDPLGAVDGVPDGEQGDLAATFWLALTLAQAGREEQARQVFERLLDLRNDVGLLGEQYHPLRRQQAGNYPLAASHLSLVGAASALDLLAGQPAPAPTPTASVTRARIQG